MPRALRLLSWAAWRQRERELQRFGQRIGDHLRRGRAMRHQRPFLRNSVRDIVVNQAAQAHFGFSRKSRRQNHDRSQRTGLTIDHRIRFLIVTPHLRGGERNEKSEKDTKRR